MTPEDQKKQIAKQKREAKRHARMLSGLNDLETWMIDILRQGLAALESQPYSFWTSMASRMTDSQVKGADRIIKQMALIPASQPNWPAKMLEKMTQLYMLIKAFRRINDLPPELATDVKTFAGISIRKEDVLNGQKSSDNWLIIGVLESVEEDLKVRRTWLLGTSTGQMLQIRDYAHGAREFTESYTFGATLKGEIVFYPGSIPLRGIFSAPYDIIPFQTLPPGYRDFDQFLSKYSHSISQSPWMRTFPFFLDNVFPVINDDQFFLVDQENNIIPCLDHDLSSWKLLAFSGGHPCSVFGEWNGKALFPLSAHIDGRLVNLKI
ncbi:MAG: hypothetical protein AAF502_14955 [Bacteroidota bacterium]